MKMGLKLLLCFLVSINTFAQNESDDKFRFDAYYEAIDYEEEGKKPDIPGHYLGKDVAAGLALLKENYTFVPEPSPMNLNPASVVEKPYIYNAVKKMGSYYKKQVKKNGMPKEEAIDKFKDIMNIAMTIRHLETGAFEETLRKTKDPAGIEAVFARVEFSF